MRQDTSESLAPVSLVVEAEKVALYAEVTDDYNPIHLDPEFAANTAMGGIIAHGTMSHALIVQSLAATFGAERAAKAEIDIRFTAPVRLGDVVTAGGVADPDEAGRFRVWVRSQSGQDVIKGWARL